MNKYFLMSAWLVTFCVAVVVGATAQTTTGNGGAKTSGKQTAAPEEAVKLETPTGNLYGTLLMPRSNKKVPVVLIIAGSGPTDRDGNSPLLNGAN
ncbi:MAG TPA: hypothetical protein VK400_03785, partial [Pyrinomonadaceae bacterium]|nr:hypothetical protein [Pyrinomonadaceae bacterium]